MYRPLPPQPNHRSLIARASLCAVAVLLLLTTRLWAARQAAAIPLEEISWGLVITGLLGGLGLFLYGMEKMSEGMKLAAGNKFRSILKALTANRVVALLFGALVTMSASSSSWPNKA